MLIQMKFNGRGSRSLVSSRSISSLAMALVCGSLVAACSGTIETPTEEFPARNSNSNTAAADDDDDDTAAATTPRPAAPARPAASAADDEDDDEAAAADDPDPIEAEEPDEEEPAAEPAGDVSFASDIQPIFNTGCGPCHVTSGIVHNIGSDDLEEALADAVEYEEAVLSEIESGEMPPTGCDGPPGSGGTCISAEDFAAIEAWYAAGTPQ